MLETVREYAREKLDASDEVRALREQRHVYMIDDSRMNVAGLRAENIGYFAESVAQVLNAAK